MKTTHNKKQYRRLVAILQKVKHLALIGYGTVALVHFGFANVVVLEINRQMLQVVSIDKKP
jgi:hypothetical protein